MFDSCLEHLRNNLRLQFLHGQAPRSATITASQVRFVDGCLSADSRLASLKTCNFLRQDPPFSLISFIYDRLHPRCRGCFPTHAHLSWGSHLLLTTCRTRKCGAWRGRLSENLSSGPLCSDTDHLVMPHWIRKKMWCHVDTTLVASWNPMFLEIILSFSVTDMTQGIGAKIQGVPCWVSWLLALSKLAELKWRFFFAIW